MCREVKVHVQEGTASRRRGWDWNTGGSLQASTLSLPRSVALSPPRAPKLPPAHLYIVHFPHEGSER